MTYPYWNQSTKIKFQQIKGYVISKNKIIALKMPGEFSEAPSTELPHIGAWNLMANEVRLHGRGEAFGPPEIFNSDQSSPFTSDAFTSS